MDNLVWLIIMAPCSALFTGIGIFAWKRKKPMWFWSGTAVKDEEIENVGAYNRANGIMWIGFSLILWASTISSFWSSTVSLICLLVGLIVGIPGLVFAYNKIYSKYKRK